MYLLDTHTLLWYLSNSDQLSDKARNIINGYAYARNGWFRGYKSN